MEQPTLVCDFVDVQKAAHDIAASDEGVNSSQRPPLLRRISQSDSHMDVPKPHFLQAPESSYKNSFHHILSGLFESNSSKQFAAIPESSKQLDSKMDSNFEQPINSSRFDRNQSAFELTSAASSNSLSAGGEGAGDSVPLRKVSSTLHNFAPFSNSGNYPDHSPKHSSQQSSLSHWWNNQFGLGQQHDQHNTSSITRIPEEDQGLMMSFRNPTGATSALGAVKSAGLLDSSGSSNASSTISNNDSLKAGSESEAKPRNPLGGACLGLFSRGFLGKQALGTQSDNYRYIMALDR